MFSITYVKTKTGPETFSVASEQMAHTIFNQAVEQEDTCVACLLGPEGDEIASYASYVRPIAARVGELEAQAKAAADNDNGSKPRAKRQK